MNASWVHITGMALQGLIALVLVSSGAVKLLKPPKMIVENFTKWHLIGRIKLIGAGELAAGVLLALPWTNPFGVLVASANWGGAITVHMSHDENYAPPAVFLILLWAGTALRYPALFGLG